MSEVPLQPWTLFPSPNVNSWSNTLQCQNPTSCNTTESHILQFHKFPLTTLNAFLFQELAWDMP